MQQRKIEKCESEVSVYVVARSMLNGASFFFFQAEDGIRDVAVTGVQTCALPISLADRDVNIVAVQSFPYASSGKALTRFVFDDPTKARSVLDAERATYTETEVVKVDLPNRLGELAGAAQKIGDAGGNINHLSFGGDPKSNTPPIIFVVAAGGNTAPLG